MDIALIKDNVVINVAVFEDSASDELVNEIRIANGADLAINTNSYPGVGINHTWHGDHFRSPSPYPSWVWAGSNWEPPIVRPEDGLYSWDEETTSWKLIESIPVDEVTE